VAGLREANKKGEKQTLRFVVHGQTIVEDCGIGP
jgi:hypothetical protein